MQSATIERRKRLLLTILMRKLNEAILLHCKALCGLLFIKTLWATLSVRTIGRDVPESIKRAGGQYIYTFWHGSLLLMVYGYVGERLTFLVSWHQDGELAARVMRHFGMKPTRGSSSKGGVRALYQLLRSVRDGYDIAFTPDGPRGPARKVQAGLIQTARLSRLPIVPVGFAAQRAKTLRSWDTFQIPYPFTRVVFCYGDPVTIPREVEKGDLKALCKEVESSLNLASRRAQNALADEPLWQS